jgi:hypothetical protein
MQNNRDNGPNELGYVCFYEHVEKWCNFALNDQVLY